MKTKTTNAVTRVRKYFPQVNKAIDATEAVLLTVKKEDSKAGRKKDPANCALAKACRRIKGVDGAIINIGYSYLIKGDTAIRYKTSEAVGREITSFDRHQDFSPGKDYRLSPVPPASRFGKRHRSEKSLIGGPKVTKAPKPKVHHTNRIRVSGA